MPNKMRRHLFILFILIYFSACGQKSNKIDNISTSDSIQEFSITKATKQDFEKAKLTNKDRTLYDTSIYNKINGIIKLPIEEKWRPYIIFKDTALDIEAMDSREYKYLGQLDKIGYYIVGGTFYEHFENYLVDKNTGKIITIWNVPKVSPNDKFVANLSIEFGMEGEPNGLQVWKVINQGQYITIEKYFELDQRIWIPKDFVWETDYSLILKVLDIDKNVNEQSNIYYLRLKLK